MTRNLDRRVEAIVPVEDPEIVKDLQEILAVMLADNRQAWDLQPDGHYIQRHPADGHQRAMRPKNLNGNGTSIS
jgi:polyphosphate kinase